MIEYDCYIPGLGYALQQAKASASDPENQPASSLASIVGCDGSVIQEMTTGSNRLVPYEFAARVSQASMMICKLGNPLDIVRCDANDRTYKPIAAETGREPHKCEQSVAIRRRLLQWFADGAVRPAAAAQ